MPTMMKTPLVTFGILVILLSLGCAEMGNFFVPPHKKSDYGDQSKECLYLTVPPAKAEAAFPAALLATAAVGLLVDRTAAAIKKESERYKASYSARETKDLLIMKDASTTVLNWDTLTFVRYLGKDAKNRTCADLKNDPSVEKAVEFISKVDRDKSEITAESLTLNKTKAKVASTRWFVPWSWWMLIDRSSEKVELKATVVMSAIAQTEKGSQPKDIISADLPLGKYDLDDDVSAKPIKDVSSGPFVIPALECKATPCTGPKTTVTVTLTESNDLGDILGDASKKVTDNKQSIINFVLEQLKIESPKNGK
ncbi:MAG TPA: hypothetical protein PLY42_06180 [Nitrospira sp.]|nr:hypothetical protein [Nitrospira sp.]HNE32929.1 hypothetical protein [Nitrospira sp.]HNM18444.1 hypothetical protein [Nitrospira sp.]HNP40884.1 hypothetical protein [Nitrospira sp.]